jgi:hypothetical protein
VEICTVENCGVRHYGRGFCNRHYQRWRTHGDPLAHVPYKHHRAEPKSRYVAVSGPEHNEHRLLATRALGRPLPRKAHVHHHDGDGRNNKGNLVICPDMA